MLDVLNKHLSTTTSNGCVVAHWVERLSEEEQKAFLAVKENSAKIKIAHLFSDLHKEEELPFKLTAFRSHMRGYCTCRN
jgi:hypothetical protein